MNTLQGTLRHRTSHTPSHLCGQLRYPVTSHHASFSDQVPKAFNPLGTSTPVITSKGTCNICNRNCNCPVDERRAGTFV